MDGGYIQVSNVEMPAGYTYFAQFVFHDLTSGTPARLDLRPLYGDGPGRSPQLYDSEGFLRIGRDLGRGIACDVPRDRSGRAVIGDWRNDRTIMLAQVHAGLLQLHNLTLASLGGSKQAAFSQARRCVEEQYRWLVVNDLLPRLVGRTTVDPALGKRCEYKPLSARPGTLPLEFSLAVGRFGHAMVKPRYRLNDDLDAVVFGERGGSTRFGDLRGQPLDERARIDWSHFFPVGNPGHMQRAAKLNTRICRPLLELPQCGRPVDPATRSIACRTLAAEEAAGLPAGQDVARAMGFEPLPDDVLWRETPYRYAQASLWFYVLREAEHQCHGRRLGQVGASIVARVVLDALAFDDSIEDQPPGPPSATTVGELLSSVVCGRLPAGERG